MSFEGLQIDPEAFFTILPVEILLRIGAPSTSLRVAIDLEDGRTVESPVYSIGLSVRGRIGVSLAVAFEGARPVLGSKFLEDLGLRINAKSGLLEPSRDLLVLGKCED
jgi:predicted aspartyl protease